MQPWQEWSRRLKEVLGLDGSPVAVTYTDVPAANGRAKRVMACAAFHLARRGMTFNMTAEQSVCPGGTRHLGLAEDTSWESFEATKRFLVHGEKFRSCYAAYFRSGVMNRARPPYYLARYVVIGPAEEAEQKPDLFLIFCEPAQASRLVVLATYESGLPLKVQVSGSTCGSAVTYPLATGRINVSFIDPSSRHLVKGFKPSELIFSVPYFYMSHVVDAIDRSTAGTAAPGMTFGELLSSVKGR